MSVAPTAKQSLRRVIVGLFPWLPGVVAVAGAQGKGLAIRAAGGLLHLMGGPGDPAVHRVGDAGVAGSLTFQFFGPMSLPPNTLLITYIAPDGTPQILTISQLTIVSDGGPFTINFATRATTGSEKVTSA
jgi:hypothetical protein